MTVTAEQIRNILKLHKKDISTDQAKAFLDLFGGDLAEVFTNALNRFVKEKFNLQEWK